MSRLISSPPGGELISLNFFDIVRNKVQGKTFLLKEMSFKIIRKIIPKLNSKKIKVAGVEKGREWTKNPHG